MKKAATMMAPAINNAYDLEKALYSDAKVQKILDMCNGYERIMEKNTHAAIRLGKKALIYTACKYQAEDGHIIRIDREYIGIITRITFQGDFPYHPCMMIGDFAITTRCYEEGKMIACSDDTNMDSDFVPLDSVDSITYIS